MKCTFLGTGTSQGVPVIACDCAVCTSADPHDTRLRTSVYLEVGDVHLVIDTGPDFRQQMLRVPVQRLDAVLFTHQHKDHTAGLDDIRGFNFKHEMVMPLYGSAEVLAQLQREFAYIFEPNPHIGLPKVSLQPITAGAFNVGSLTVQAISLMHNKLPVFGFRIGNFTYITDANYISEEEKSKIRGAKCLVINALRQHPHPSHFTLSEAIALAQELAVPQVYFTHISHLLGLHAEVSPTLPKGMALAYDGLCISL